VLPVPTAPHWNETAEKKLGVLADEDKTLQQNNSSNSSYSNVVQKEITLPSRLIYYINQDSESPYHVLDTKARHQQKHNKVGRKLVGQNSCHKSFPLI
jgi:disintegrin and metalloproteinase domain-containing protein 23